MNEFVDINENRKLKLMVQEKNARICSVDEVYLEGDTPVKGFLISRWMNYGFHAFSINNPTNRIDFAFDSNHPLYLPLIHLLKNKDSLIINDSNTEGQGLRYLNVKVIDGIIYLSFINNIRANDPYEKFDIIVRGRYNFISFPLDDFFDEIALMVREFNNEVTLESYLTKSRSLKNE